MLKCEILCIFCNMRFSFKTSQKTPEEGVCTIFELFYLRLMCGYSKKIVNL